MGHVIADVISKRDDCTVVAGIDKYTDKYADFPIFKSPAVCDVSADVIIDFSNPNMLEDLLQYAIERKTPLIIATTGYSQEQIELIQNSSKEIPIFFTFNMSLGINLLVELAKKATQVLNGQFDIEIIEKHHNLKVDSPSGTAIMLAEAINEVADFQYGYKYDRHAERMKRNKREIGIHTVRGGTIVGEHEVMFAGRDEVITLSHSARSKEVFAVGAVNAAIFMKAKPAGLYDMKQLIE